MWYSRSARSPRKSVMGARPRSSDMVVTTPAGLLSARYTRSWRLGTRLPSTLMTCRSGSTLAPYRRTICPSTSTRPSAISSSHRRRLPTPAAASTFCRRTPPGTSVSESCPGSSVRSMPRGVFPPPALSALPCTSGCLTGRRRPPRRSRPSRARALIARIARILSRPGTVRARGTARIRAPGVTGVRRTLRVQSAGRGGGTAAAPRTAGARETAKIPSTSRARETATVPGTTRVWSTARGRGIVKAPGIAWAMGAGDARRVLLGAVGILDLVGQERREVGQLVQAGQAEALQEVRGRAVEDGAGLVFGARLLDQAAQGQGTHDRVTVDTPHGRDPRAAERMPVGDHGQRLQRGLGQPDLLPVADESLHHRCALLAGIEAPATRHLAQVESPAFGGVRGGEVGDLARDLLPRPLKYLGKHHLGDRLINHQQDRFQAGPQARAGLGRADRVPRHVVVHHDHSSSSRAELRGPVPFPAQITCRSPSGTRCSNETLPSR